jgi:hypothetical protein
MSDDHAEPRAEFPTGMLVGGLVLSLAVVAVLTVFVFVMGSGHGPAPNAAPPAATRPAR